MNVLFFLSWYRSPGNLLSGIFFRDQALAVKQAGVNVYIIALNEMSLKYPLKYFMTKNKKEIFDDNGITTYILNYLNIFPVRCLPKLHFLYGAFLFRKALRFIENSKGIKIDIVHIHSALDAGIFYWFSQCKLKFMITEHATFYKRDMLTASHKKYLPYVFSQASYIAAVSNGLRNDIGEYTPNKINVIYNCVAMDNFNPLKDTHKKKFRIFSIGAPLHKKGMDILIAAFAASTVLQFCELYIAGLETEEIKILTKMIDTLGIAENITLFGRIPRKEVAYYMYNADCFALTSRFETFGVVFIEAMYFGKPVIASSTGGPDSFITPETGLIVPVEDIEKTKIAIENMYYNINKYDPEYIKRYAIDNFSGEKIAMQIKTIYESIINE
jgi:glycosyltransferase involved in cell wall biosynthesis